MEGLCKKNWIRYQRFMDDYVIFAKTRNKLKAAIKRMYAVRARRLHEKGADSRWLLQYVQRWVTWLHGGLQGAVAENRFNQIWNYVNQQLKI